MPIEWLDWRGRQIVCFLRRDFVDKIPRVSIIDITCDKKEVNEMSTVRVGENESLDNAIRRFKRKCARDGIIGDLRKREAYEKPSVKRKKKAEAARKRAYKN